MFQRWQPSEMTCLKGTLVLCSLICHVQISEVFITILKVEKNSLCTVEQFTTIL